MISVNEALQIILENGSALSSQIIPVETALSFALVNDIKSDRPFPPFNRVAMDGFAVRSTDFTDHTMEFNIIGQVQTGVSSDLVVKPGEAIRIMTGAPCPQGADAVVKIENATILGDKVQLREEKMKPGLNIATRGEDAEKGKTLIKAGSPLSTAGIAICASVGIPRVEVFRKPRVKIISTGTEIVSPVEAPLEHQIRDCNSYTLRALSRSSILESQFLGIGEDDLAVLGKMIRDGLDSDILMLSGGVSMGEFDHIPHLLSENGVTNLFHNVRVKPGKPLWFGKTEKGTFVFGLPGNPVSVQTCFRIFVEPLIRKLSGYTNPLHRFLRLPLTEQVRSKSDREHFMPGILAISESSTSVQPIYIKGSGDFSNFEPSQGLFAFPAEKKELEAGDLVDFLPWREIW
jgi:molybdopterin molybdotransferase